MRANRFAATVAAALLAACATPDDYRPACRAEHADSADIETCANQRADSANTTATIVAVLGVVAIGAIAALAAGSGSGGGDSRNDYSGLCALALKRC
jgi:hypothetical protein